MSIRTYTELMTLQTFEERFNYCKVTNGIGIETFGHNRYLNQMLYNSPEWRRFRREVIIRDEGRDLGCEGYELGTGITVHHLNPITVEQVLNRDPVVFSFDNVICCSNATHKAIHYSSLEICATAPIERFANDTSPWRL